jgi:hypothetical protein
MTEVDIESVVKNFPVEITARPDGNQILINHFICRKEGHGYASKVLSLIESCAVEHGYNAITINMGRLGGDTDVISWLEYHDYDIVDRLTEPDHVTAIKDL